MKLRGLLTIILLAGFIPGMCQYIENPSFEGTILMIGPPPAWEMCIEGSTPNVQPGKYNVYLSPSHGITYVGLLTRENFTWEDMYASLNVPLSKDSCYIFKIDLAFQEYLSFTVVQPIILKVYGSNVTCQKNNLLWQSPPISNEDWITYEFMIHNEEYDITDLILETYYVGAIPYWGYMLLDNIRITRTPIAELGNDTTLVLCESDSLVLDPGSGFNGYLWQDGSIEQTYVVDTTGLYWVQVFNAEGCSWTDSIFVTVEEYVYMIPEMIDSTLVCEGQEVTITIDVINGVPPYSFEWINLPDTTESITVVVDSTMYYYVNIEDNCGFTIMDSVKIVAIASPDINLGNDTLICPDGNYTLYAGEGYSEYLWQDGSLGSEFIVTEPGTFWVEVTSNFGCIGRDSVTIDLFPPIPLDVGNDTILCIGESVVFHAGGGFVDYVWQDNSSDSIYTAYNTGVYWVTVTDIYGCHATDTVYASFLPLPEVDLGNDLSMCSGEEIYLDAGGGFQSYQWQDNDTSQYYSVTQGGLYWVTVYNGCGEDTDSVYVEAYSKPEPDLGPDTTICSGGNILLDPGSYVSYLWQDNSILPWFTVTNAGAYSVTVESSDGCFGDDEIFINVSTSQVNLGGDQQVCEGETVELDAGEGFQSYLWQDNTTEQTYSITISGAYSVTVVDEYGCASSDEVIYSYYPYPNPSLGPDQIICEGETTILYAPDGEYAYYWNGIEGDQSYEVSSSGQYSLSLVNPCDSVSDEIGVVVEPLPVVNIGEDDILFPGKTIELSAGEGFDEYMWQDGSGTYYFVVTEHNIDPTNPYFYVEVTEGICKSSDTVMIELFEVWVPIVITPNGDGENDIFRPDLESWSGVKQHTIIVFNRWGEKIWESADFEAGWDGKQNGRYVAEGTYFWVLEVYYGPNNIQQTLKGSLTVLGTNN